MKTLTTIAAKFTFLLAVTLLIFNIAVAQNTKKEKEAKKAAETQQLIDSKSYVFKASYMTPMRAPGKVLTDDYDVQITNDSLVSYMPYYGRLFMAPTDPSKNSMEFTSTRFAYSVATKKNGSWQISIATTDNREIRKLLLEVSPDGYATLNVISYNQDPISYEGVIEPVPTKKG